MADAADVVGISVALMKKVQSRDREAAKAMSYFNHKWKNAERQLSC